MPTFITHAFAAFTAGKIILDQSYGRRILLTGTVCAMLPDADVVGFYYAIPYESVWGHRGITHSFFFAGLLAAGAMLFFRNIKPWTGKWWMVAFFFFLSTASHSILDAMTNGGRGVAFFAPFHNERYFLPWRPIKVSPLSAGSFLQARGLLVLLSELIWVWMPCLVVLFLFKRKKVADR